MDGVAILIPAYEPDAALAELVPQLKSHFEHVVVVDDGSSRGSEVFDGLRVLVDTVLRHEVNRGKGAALKTGFAWIRERLPEVRTVVTVDADGQHRLADVLKVAAASLGHSDGLTLGVREFAGEVPFRSRLGNVWTRVLFRLLTGLAVRDTQTGLRGIPRGLFARMGEIPGDRYEYELRMLVDARSHAAPPLQIPIETVYLEGNGSSHYRPLRDTFRTQWALWSSVFRFKGFAK